MGHGSAAHLSVLPQGKGITLRMRHAPHAQIQALIFASIFTVIGHEDASLAASPASHVFSSRASHMATKRSLRTRQLAVGRTNPHDPHIPCACLSLAGNRSLNRPPWRGLIARLQRRSHGDRQSNYPQGLLTARTSVITATPSAFIMNAYKGSLQESGEQDTPSPPCTKPQLSRAFGTIHQKPSTCASAKRTN